MTKNILKHREYTQIKSKLQFIVQRKTNFSSKVEPDYTAVSRDRPMGGTISELALYPVIFYKEPSNWNLPVDDIITEVILYPSGPSLFLRYEIKYKVIELRVYGKINTEK